MFLEKRLVGSVQVEVDPEPGCLFSQFVPKHLKPILLGKIIVCQRQQLILHVYQLPVDLFESAHVVFGSRLAMRRSSSSMRDSKSARSPARSIWELMFESLHLPMIAAPRDD